MPSNSLLPKKSQNATVAKFLLVTLRNWRSMRIGPGFVKIGKAILYPITELDAWDEQNRVACRTSKRLMGSLDDQA